MPEAASNRGWVRVTFGEMAKHIAERVEPTPDDCENYVGLEHLDTGSLTIRRWGAEVALIGTKLRMRKGDILFARRNAYLRRVALAPHDGLFSAHGMVLRARPNVVLPEFLPFFMQSDLFMDRAEQISVGSLSPTINWGTLKNQKFDLPPLEEQRRISAVLGAMEVSDEAMSEAERSIQAIRTSHLNDFFEPRFRSGVPLTKVSRVVAGGTPSRADPTLWGGGRPWASGKDLKIRNLRDTEETLTEKGWEQAKVAPAGATLIVVRGMILAHTFPVARCEQNIAFNQDLRALVAGDRLEPDYLLLWTEWAARWFLRCTAISSHGTKRIEGHLFDKALVPIPSRDEQSHLVVEHATIIDAEAGLRQRRASYQALRRLVMKAALEGSR